MSINRKLAIRIFIKGRVQGVSFRYFTFTGSESEYRGLVRNNPKGNVEAFAQGDKTNLGYLLKYYNRGHPFIGWMK